MKILIDNVEVILVRDAALLANRTTATIYNWINEGLIQSKQHNNQMYVVKQSLIDYLSSKNSGFAEDI